MKTLRISKRALLISGVLFTLLFSVGLRASEKLDQAFSWNPKAITLSGMPGDRVSFSVSAHAGNILSKTLCLLGASTVPRLSENLSAVAVSTQIVPGAICKADTTLTVTLYLSPSAPEGIINGEMRLFRKARVFGREVTLPVFLAEPLLITLSIETFDDGLPPDPGEAGKVTIEGVDANKDGLRDDIERYIAETYPGRSEENVRKALRQQAKGFQMALLAASDEAESVKVLHERERDGYCLTGVMGIEMSSEAQEELKAQVLNTEMRTRAWVSFNRNIGGEVGGDVPQETYVKQCDFSL